ncbi:MAG: PilZ domain-containing protein [Acidobacteria bacterium]|nr:PilZ domain-containing protein [Acidobacteriota bacterium]
MSDQEKRRLQRLDLKPPSDAKLSGLAVMMLDLSTAGARVEHAFPMKAGQRGKLDFIWNGLELSLQCEVVRTRLQKSTVKPGSIVYHTGLRFTDPAEDSRVKVRHIVASLAGGRAASSQSAG